MTYRPDYRFANQLGRRTASGGWKEWDEPATEEDYDQLRVSKHKRWNRSAPPKYSLQCLDEEVTHCKKCGKPIFWVKSQRTGKFYPVNITYVNGKNHYRRNDFHKCG
jgi:hypothetical protein